MKIDKLTFLPHRLKRRGSWQTASYSADYVDVFYVTIHTDDGVSGLGPEGNLQRDEATLTDTRRVP